MTSEIEDLNRQILAFHPKIEALQIEMATSIVGQKYLIDRLLIALIANGHVLLEGVPGLARRRRQCARPCLHAKFARIQFTPGPAAGRHRRHADLQSARRHLHPKLGPIFANFVLADEINRAPAKVQSALLEAMQERQVTLGEKTYRAARARSSSGHAESGRAGGHLSAARGAGRPLHAQGAW